MLGVLPKLVPTVTACLEGSTGPDGASSVPPPLAVATAALGVLESLVFLLRSTMRPHVKRVEGVTALWLQVRLDPFAQIQCHAFYLWKQSGTRDT